VSGRVYWLTAEKLGHNWLNAVFGVITLPDPIHLNSTQLILKFSELPDWLVFS
jgi:hypothetical protein